MPPSLPATQDRCPALRAAFREVRTLDAAFALAREKYDQGGGAAELAAARAAGRALRAALSALERGVAELEFSRVAFAPRSFDTSDPAVVAACLKEKKPLPETPEAAREILDLREQYGRQVMVLRSLEAKDEATGAVRRLFREKEGRLVMDGIDPADPTKTKEYALPSYEDVLAKMAETSEKAELLRAKAEQGFKRLQITPFALPLQDLIGAYKGAILRAHQEGRLHDTQGEVLELRDKATGGAALPSAPDAAKDPLDAWSEYTKGTGADRDGRLVYHPKAFTKENHGGKTKAELLSAPAGSPDALTFSGFIVELLEENQTIPRAGEGEPEGGRPRIEAGKKPNDYLAGLQSNSAYKGESGTTPEDGLMEAIASLESGEGQIDNYANDKDSVSYNLAGWFPAGGYVASARWDRAGRRAGLGGVRPGGADGNRGCRSAARI